MKKLLIGLSIVLAVSIISIYVFIPRHIFITRTEVINSNNRWAFNYLINTESWAKWWPKDNKRQDSTFIQNGQQFEIDSLFYNALNINIIRKGDTSHTKLVVTQVSNDETHLFWQCELDGTNNPVTRLEQYQTAIAIRENFETLLATYKNWLNVSENIYGFDIKPAKIIDTMLLAKRAQFKNNYPTPVQVDSLFKIIRDYATLHHAKENGLPMLHVVSNEPGIYQAEVALPLDTRVPETNELKMKRMFAGNALVTKFKGGPYTIQKAYEASEHYKQDHLKTSPAIPFQSLVTDRVAEPDTSKWETILYDPIY